MRELHVAERVVIPASDLSWAAARSGGPGGQNVNKVSSKVELRFDLEGTRALDPSAKDRLRTIAKNRIDADGCILIVSQTTRDQVRNLQDARDRLAELVRQALIVPKRRRKTKPTRSSVERRIESKKRRAETKRGRRGPDFG